MNKITEEKFLCKKINDLFSVRLKLQKKTVHKTTILFYGLINIYLNLSYILISVQKI